MPGLGNTYPSDTARSRGRSPVWWVAGDAPPNDRVWLFVTTSRSRRDALLDGHVHLLGLAR